MSFQFCVLRGRDAATPVPRRRGASRSARRHTPSYVPPRRGPAMGSSAARVHAAPPFRPASAAGRRPRTHNLRKYQNNTDCHTSDIGHWFAMTDLRSVRTSHARPCADSSLFTLHFSLFTLPFSLHTAKERLPFGSLSFAVCGFTPARRRRCRADNRCPSRPAASRGCPAR